MSKRILLKLIIMTTFSLIILCAIWAPNINLRYAEGGLIVFAVFLLYAWQEKSIQLKCLKHKYQRRNDILEDIFKHSPDLIFYKDLNFKYLGCNDTFARSHNLTTSGVIGKTDFELIPQCADEIRHYDEAVIKKGDIIYYEQIITRNDNTKVVYQAVKSPMFEDGEIVGVLGIMRDITLLKNIEYQKESFIATLTHDLKTPTTAQMKAIELLLHNAFGEVSDPQREILMHILNSCKYMYSMISTILATYKYDLGEKTLEYSEFDLNEIINEVCSELKWFIDEKNLNLQLDLLPGKLIMNADKLEIKRVIMNLVSNAVSYSIESTNLKIKAYSENDKTGFAVQNISRHIPQEDLEQLFEKYFIRNVKFRQIGTGLGLYLAKSIIQSHNGNMIVKSDEVSGNVFGFELDKSPVKVMVS